MHRCWILKKRLHSDHFYLTKDAEEFSQFDGHVACREYTLPRDDESSTPKGWIRGNTKIGPVLEVVTNNFEGKPGVKIKIESFIERRISLVDQNPQRTEQIRERSDRENTMP